MSLVQDLLKPATDWLSRQRSETVILVAILVVMIVALFQGLPWATSEVKEHIHEINSSHEKQINTISETFDRANGREHELIQGLLRSHGIEVSRSAPSGIASLRVNPDGQAALTK